MVTPSDGRLNGFEVKVGNHVQQDRNAQCGGKHNIAQGKSATVNCGGKKGRYVYVVNPKTDVLTLCEVKIEGAP